LDEDDVFETSPPPPASAFALDDISGADDIPLVPTELIGSSPPPLPSPPPAAEPFDDFEDYFASPPPTPAPPPPPSSSGISVRRSTSALSPLSEPTEVPMMSIEIPLPEGILNSLPNAAPPTDWSRK
jgi:hypothetical protein